MKKALIAMVKDESKAPALTDYECPWVVVEFIHSDEKPHRFYSVINKMSGNRLSAFDNDAPGIDDPMPWIHSIVRNISRNAKNVSVFGTMKIKES